MFMSLKDGALVLVSETPAPVVFCITPPDESPPLVAVKAGFAPAERLTPPENVMAPPEPPWSLLSSRIPVPPKGDPEVPTAPVNDTAALPGLFCTVTALPALMFE